MRSVVLSIATAGLFTLTPGLCAQGFRDRGTFYIGAGPVFPKGHFDTYATRDTTSALGPG
jgi:hypothetical protein